MVSELKLQKIIPIRYVVSSWVPLLLIAVLPSSPLLYLLKFVFVIWIVLNVVSSFRDYWKDYETLGAFVTINTVLFAAMLFFNLPSWLGTLFVCEFFLSFATMFRHIDKFNRGSGKLSSGSNDNNSKWSFFINSVDSRVDKKRLEAIINEFLIPDNIDPKKFLANSGLLLYQNRKNYKLNVEIRNQEDLSDYTTPSIDEFGGIGSQPMAFTGENQWFLIAYPDVVKWLQGLKESQVKKIFAKFKTRYSNDGLDDLNKEDLRLLVDEYVGTGKALECSSL